MLLFGYAALVQLNDPDPWGWTLLYLAAAAACGIAMFERLPLVAPLAVAGVALAWAALIFANMKDTSIFLRMFDTYTMMSPAQEEAREILGLAIVAASMGALARR